MIIFLFLSLNAFADYGVLNKKSLNQTWNSSSFASCVGKEAFLQHLSSTHQFLLLGNTELDERDISLWAYIYLITKNKETGKRESFRLAMKSLDTVKGWQIITFYDLETAPYTESMLDHGVITNIDGSASIGDVDLSNCKNN
jgi:hypothetical protein